jgi:signal transduction histidine kinase
VITPLAKLRLRLTAWYAGTFGFILLLLGGGLFVVIRGQLAGQLDRSLRDATTELVRAARIREVEAVAAHGAVVDAVDELHIPDRALYLFDLEGRVVKPARADEWIGAAARRAGVAGSVDLNRQVAGGRELRLHAERFVAARGRTYVAVAVADQRELEDEYSSLIAVFASAALAALVLTAVGGAVLIRTSSAPVERTMEFMRRFMADAAHELRTPLTVLRTRAEVTLQREREGPAYADALREIEREAGRLGGIVEDLLMLARADAGERPLRRETAYLDDVALDVAGALKPVAERAGVSLELGDCEEAAVTGDPALLRQLAMIVLDNAVKFTPAGGRVRLDVAVRESRPGFTVTDTGIGIAAEHLPHVFERFYRGDPARGPGEGAGLGLAIARWIVDAHGADIALVSTTGSGTTVTVRFPPALSSS